MIVKDKTHKSGTNFVKIYVCVSHSRQNPYDICFHLKSSVVACFLFQIAMTRQFTKNFTIISEIQYSKTRGSNMLSNIM